MATITIKNVDRLIMRLKKVSGLDLREPMVKATTLVHGQAKNLAPVDKGNLSGSIHMEVKSKGNDIEGRVFTNLQYAPFVEFGTGITGDGTYPYTIDGLNLSYRDTPWVYSPDGENFYTTKGQVAQPFMYPALKQHEKYIKRLFQDSAKDYLAKGGR